MTKTIRRGSGTAMDRAGSVYEIGGKCASGCHGASTTLATLAGGLECQLTGNFRVAPELAMPSDESATAYHDAEATRACFRDLLHGAACRSTCAC